MFQMAHRKCRKVSVGTMRTDVDHSSIALSTAPNSRNNSTKSEPQSSGLLHQLVPHPQKAQSYFPCQTALDSNSDQKLEVFTILGNSSNSFHKLQPLVSVHGEFFHSLCANRRWDNHCIPLGFPVDPLLLANKSYSPFLSSS